MADDISLTSSGNQAFDFTFIDSEPKLAEDEEEEEQFEEIQELLDAFEQNECRTEFHAIAELAAAEARWRASMPTTRSQPQAQASSTPRTTTSNLPQQTSTSTSTSTMSKTTIDGEEIEYNVGNMTTTKVVILFPKDKRVKLSEEKKTDFFEKVTKAKLTKFDLVSLTLSDEDKLDDTYCIGVQVTKMSNHLGQYDSVDVFRILKIDPEDKTKPLGDFVDLLTNYSSLTEKEVALSNEWYRLYTKEEWIRKNLQLSLEYLENNCTEQLWEKVIEIHDEFLTIQRGGPLAFLIMMQLLQGHTDSAVQYLLNSVTNLKISSAEGEKVNEVVSLIRGAYRRLKTDKI
jgi:hypothetical protein